tara:strand:+ start:2480 stop:2851 length:372 start_codon:yes stop_codon:yes gene_type:complete
MVDIICKNNNLFNRQLLDNEEKRICIIIGLIENCKNTHNTDNTHNTCKIYDKLINKYNEIFKIREIHNLKKIEILKITRDYLKNEIDELILKNGSEYLLEEMVNEFNKINEIILMNYTFRKNL